MPQSCFSSETDISSLSLFSSSECQNPTASTSMDSPPSDKARVGEAENDPGATSSRPAHYYMRPSFVEDSQQSPHRPQMSNLHRHHSRVSMDYFDPQGALRLCRALSNISQTTQPSRLEEGEDESETSSDRTLTIGPGVDFERLVKNFIKRRDKSEIKPRHLGVAFSDLRVVGIGASASFAPTLGSLFNVLNIFRGIQSLRHPPLRDIISGFDGVVRPGEMLLVLGRPGSGCSTLLKILANHRSGFHRVEGDVIYDSLSAKEVAKHYRGDVQYCPEDDVHFPTLTVGQTISFAAKSRAPQTRLEGQTRGEHNRIVTDLFQTIFGLNHVKNTVVGNEATRGVSGGEKKRVSISEAMATRSLLTSWDNSTRGLDSSTALEYIQALRIATDLGQNTTIVSIYQAGESLFNLFDKVCLIYEGRMAYYGPADMARQYFIDMGYVPANRQTTSDFLVSVTNSNGRTIRDSQRGEKHVSSSSNKPVPQSPPEFEKYYRDSDVYKINREDILSYKNQFVNRAQLSGHYKESALQEHARHTRKTSPYTISIPMQVRIVMLRRVQIMKGNFLTQALSTTSFVLQAVIIGTTFVKVSDDTAAYFSRGGVIFFSVFVPALFSMSEIPALFAQRPIVHRHELAALYHPMVEALAMTLVEIPFTFVTMVLFSVIIYFVVQLQQTAGQFFIYFLFIFTIALTFKCLFRGLAAAFVSAAPAQAVAGILVLALSIYAGYQIPRPSMIGALRWISYINPTLYAFDSLMTNEFHTLDGTCANLVPSGPGYEGVALANQVCPIVGAQPGQTTVNGNAYLALSFGYYHRHLWRNYGILCAFGVGFLLCLLVFSEINTRVAGDKAIILFKSGTKPAVITEAEAAVGDDEEREKVGGKQTSVADGEGKGEDAKQALAEQPKMTNVFSWDHLNYTVSVAGERRLLLDDVSGFVAPGKLTALMGESGAGKTTLLNVLAERTDTGLIAGDRFFNGQALPPDFQSQTGYCQQMDTHVGNTTVREALQFSARLRQPNSVSTLEKDAYAEKCLKMCGLEAFADAMVGTLGVEQKKRTTIGVELAAKPKLLLFLDEPTSGLDSQSAWAIVSFLRSLADNGQAILCTYVEKYSRKKGTKLNISGYTSLQQNFSRAEYMLDTIGAGATAVVDRDWNEVWVNSKECTRAKEDLQRIHEDGREHPPVAATLRSTFATPWMYQATFVLQRSFRVYWRDPTYLMSKLTLNIVGGLFIGFTFFRAKDTIQGSQNKLFAVFMATVLSAPLGGQLHVPYINMRNIYEIRERSSRMYHWTVLVTAQILVELPWNILGSTLFFFCWYWTVGFPSSRGAFTYLMYGFLFPVYYTTLALAVASMCVTADIASLMYSFLFTFVLTFDGVVQPYRQLGWWRWMYHLSPFTYLIEALVGQAVGRQLINCSSTELSTLQPPPAQTCGSYMTEYISRAGGYLTNPDAVSDCRFCSSRTTDEWLGPAFNISYSRRWRDCGIFCAYILFNASMVYILTYSARIRKHRHLEWLIAKVVKALGSFKRTEGTREASSSI